VRDGVFCRGAEGAEEANGGSEERFLASFGMTTLLYSIPRVIRDARTQMTAVASGFRFVETLTAA
jgi:hypothetical protein